MEAAKLFENGRSQAVRLPKDCRFEGKEVLTHKIGNMVLLMPKDTEWRNFLLGLDMFSDDVFSDGRPKDAVQERETL